MRKIAAFFEDKKIELASVVYEGLKSIMRLEIVMCIRKERKMQMLLV